MKVQLSGMRVQNGDSPGHAAEALVIKKEKPQRLPDALKHKSVKETLPCPCQIAQLSGKRKGQHKIFCGNLFLQLFADPFLCLMVLTMGAVTMPAGVWHKGLMALIALRCPGQQASLISLDKILLVYFKNRGQTDHDMRPQLMLKLSIILLICPSARCEVQSVRWVYRAVVITLTCPNIFCSSSRSTPASSRWVAKLWRREWQDIFLLMPSFYHLGHGCLHAATLKMGVD